MERSSSGNGKEQIETGIEEINKKIKIVVDNLNKRC